MASSEREGYASLKDVATRAGVSFQTVSKVLNGGGTVTPATVARIHRAVEEIGYVPNALARGLVTRGTRTIGIVSADLSDHGLGRFVLAAEVGARRRGWATIVANVDAFGSDVTRCVDLLAARRVEGILMAAPQAESDPALGRRLAGRLPVVGLHHIHGLCVPLVGSDHVQTGRLAVAHLLGHGHRELGVVAGPLERSVTRARMAGGADALQDAGLATGLGDRVQEADWTTLGGYRAALRLLDRCPSLTALFVHNDDMAMGVLRALHERGRRVPDDVAVIGCDDARQAAFTIPSLTTIRVPFDRTGHTAMELLIGVVDGASAPTASTLLPVELVIRASCGCPEPATVPDDDPTED